MSEEMKLDIAPDAILKTVQEKRLRMLLDLEEMDKNKRYLMNELAETAVAVKKIESDENIADENKDIATEMVELLRGMKGNPFHKDNLNISPRESLPEPIVPTIIPNVGEMLQEQEELNYGDFIEDK